MGRRSAIDTPHRRLFQRSFIFFEVGGSPGIETGPFSSKTMRNYPELSWKSTTYVSQPTILIDPKQNRWRQFSPLAINPYSQLSKSRRAEARQ